MDRSARLQVPAAPGRMIKGVGADDDSMQVDWNVNANFWELFRL